MRKSFVFQYTRCWAVSCLLCCLHSHTSARVAKIAIRLWRLESKRLSGDIAAQQEFSYLASGLRWRVELESRANVDATHAACYLIHQLKLNSSMDRHYSIWKDYSHLISTLTLLVCGISIKDASKSAQNIFKTLKLALLWRMCTAYFFIVWLDLSAFCFVSVCEGGALSQRRELYF